MSKNPLRVLTGYFNTVANDFGEEKEKCQISKEKKKQQQQSKCYLTMAILTTKHRQALLNKFSLISCGDK